MPVTGSKPVLVPIFTMAWKKTACQQMWGSSGRGYFMRGYLFDKNNPVKDRAKRAKASNEAKFLRKSGE